MKDGFIYELAKPVVKFFYSTNLVEGFKYIIGKISKKDERKLKNIGIDLFIVLKWIAVLLFWYNRIDSIWAISITAYLIWTNLFTYFYYHVWDVKGEFHKDRSRRRFVNLILAVAFSNVAFAFLYDVGFAENFIVSEGFNGEISYLLFSTYNSLFADYEFINPINNIGSIISATQLSITFVFASIILSNSIPD